MRIPRSSSHPLVEAQMITLADIAFLMIFFFLQTSNFMKDKSHVELPIAPNSTRTASDIIVVMDAQKKIWLNGEPISSRNELEGSLKNLLTDKKTPDQCQVRFRCEKTLKYQDYAPVYSAISDAGGVISVIHEVGNTKSTK